MSGFGKDTDDKIMEALEEMAEESDEYSSVEEMLESGEKRTLSVRMPVRQFAEYQVFAEDDGFPSKSEAAREAIRQQLKEAERDFMLERGWSTYLAGLNEADPTVAAYGLDTIYRADESQGQVAEKYMEPLMSKISEHQDKDKE